MFERKETTYENKKYYYSNEYLRKMFESYNSQRDKINGNNNIIFKKILNLENVNISKDKPKILFRKYVSENTHFENQLKRQLVENNGYLNGEGSKKKLKKYLSHSIDRRNRLFKKFPIYNSKRKNNNHRHSNNVLPKYKNIFSKSVSKNFNRPSLNNNFCSTSENLLKRKNKEKRFSKGINSKKNKFKEPKADKKILMDKLIKNGIKEIKKRNKNKNEKESFEQTSHKKKLNFLIENNINIGENDNEKEIEKTKNITSSAGNLDIKKKNKSKSLNKNKKKNNLNIFTVKDNQKKQKNKPVIDQFEYLTKIHKELKKIRSSKSKSKNKEKNK